MQRRKNVVCVIQARMNSSRLPNKVLAPILDKPMLWYILDSLKRSKTLNKIVVATTINHRDDEIAKLAKKTGVDVFRGSENNVLNRYCEAGKKFKADYVVRICADCPLIDHNVVDKIVHCALQNNCDYVSNTLPKTYPTGYDVEVVKLSSLLKSESLTNDRGDLEHVTLFIMRKPNLFSHLCVKAPQSYNKPKIRVCVDKEEDLLLIRIIFNELYEKGKSISIKKVIGYLERNPKLAKINSHIKPIVTHGFM